MKKDRLLIISGIGALGVGLVGTLFFVTGDFGKEPFLKKEADDVLVVQPKDEKSSGKEKAGTKDEEVQRILTGYQELITPIGYGEKEFPIEQAGTFKEKLIKLAEAGEVDVLISEVERKLDGYRFSEGVNLDIAGLYYDATFTKGLVGLSEKDMRKTLPNSYKTPEMLALMPLFIPEYARRDMIHDNMSLTPLTEGPFKINGTTTIDNREDADNDEAYQENGVAISMFNVIDGIQQIHIVELTRLEEPGVPIRAYIGELSNGQLNLYGYYVPDDTTHYYQTIQFFKELDAEYIEPNAQYQQERIQKEIDEGKIPEEAIDAFLNPTQ